MPQAAVAPPFPRPLPIGVQMTNRTDGQLAEWIILNAYFRLAQLEKDIAFAELHRCVQNEDAAKQRYNHCCEQLEMALMSQWAAEETFMIEVDKQFKRDIWADAVEMKETALSDYTMKALLFYVIKPDYDRIELERVSALNANVWSEFEPEHWEYKAQ